MLKRGLVLVMSFAMVSSAFAGATVDFVVTDFGNTPCNGIDGCMFGDPGANDDGTFNGGETVLVHVMLNSDTTFFLRLAQIDWTASSPELGLGQDIDAVNQVIDGVPNFWFDYSPITLADTFALGTYPATGIGPFGSSTGGYTDFSNLQQGEPLRDFVATTLWAATAELPGMLQIVAGVPYRLGGMVVTLPAARGGGAEYTFDVLNLANTDDANLGMIIDFGFGTEGDPVLKWGSASESPLVNDSITYANGPLTLTVIPEPATLILLGLGGLAALRRRRK